MNISKLLTTVLAAVVLSPLSVSAGSFNDSKELIELIKTTGTHVSVNTNSFDKNCPGKAGYYQYIKDVSDVLVVCEDQINKHDPHELWKVISHESTHVMQACKGRNLFKESYLPRIFRTLSTKAPHYAKMIDTQYSATVAIKEAEAFYMELQPPADVMQMFKLACLSGN